MQDKQNSESTSKAVGRRKTASARVRITAGSGTVTVNGRPLADFFGTDLLRQKAIAPLEATSRATSFDVSVKVAGGGVVGQAEAVRHGLARALLLWNPDIRAQLRAEGFLTRDPRAKERKKFGRTRARRGHQWRKR